MLLLITVGSASSDTGGPAPLGLTCADLEIFGCQTPLWLSPEGFLGPTESTHWKPEVTFFFAQKAILRPHQNLIKLRTNTLETTNKQNVS